MSAGTDLSCLGPDRKKFSEILETFSPLMGKSGRFFLEDFDRVLEKALKIKEKTLKTYAFEEIALGAAKDNWLNVVEFIQEESKNPQWFSKRVHEALLTLRKSASSEEQKRITAIISSANEALAIRRRKTPREGCLLASSVHSQIISR